MNNKRLTYFTFLFLSCLFLQTSCNGGIQNAKRNSHGNPFIVIDNLIYEADSESFSLTLHADSTEGANVTYFLFDGDNLIQKNVVGVFTGIVPQAEGYNAQAQVVWKDTTIITPLTYINNFIIPIGKTEKLSAHELETLINTKDHSLRLGENKRIAQGIKITVQNVDTISMGDVFLYLNNSVWASVEVTSVDYNDRNQVSFINLNPEVLQTELYDDEWFDDEL